MPTSLVNGVQLYWETGGSGEPVILVHGSWGDHHNWDAVAPSLRESFKLVTYDRRGHSRSERPPGPGSVEEDAADLGALIEQMFQGPAHVVGNSFGAVIALRLAARRRDLFRSMAVHEPPLWGLLEGQPDTQTALAQAQQRIAAVIDLLRSGDDRGGAELFMESIAMGPGSWQLAPQALRDTFVFNAPTWLDECGEANALAFDLGRLSGFAAPVLLSHGGQSPPFFPAVVERLAGALPHAERHVFDAAGHVPHRSHPDEYVRVLGSFIGRTVAPRRP